MTQDDDAAVRVWPQAGPLAAMARPMFPLAAFWAALAIALRQWAPDVIAALPDPTMWHVHEMTFGFGGAAVAGYLCSATSSWTGRPPVQGAPVVAVVLLWCLARAGLLIPGLPGWIAATDSAGMFWTVAGILLREAWRARRGLKPGFVAAAILAGAMSAVWILRMTAGAGTTGMASLAVLGFTALLIQVGGRMVPAFLCHAAGLQDERARLPAAVLRGASLLAVAAAAVLQAEGASDAAAAALILGGIAMLALTATWPLAYARGNVLLVMLVAAVLWIPVGLALWGIAVETQALPPAAGQHALMMGAMGGLVMAVTARASARRTAQGLRARRGTGIAFCLVMLAVPARMVGTLDIAAGLWCAGWTVYGGLTLRGLSGPLPRPIFSGARR